MSPQTAAANGHVKDGNKTRICVLLASYEDSKTAMAGLDPYPTPEVYDDNGTYIWEHAYIKKATAVQQVRDLAHSKKYDVFMNLCDGAFDEDRAGQEVVNALERYGCAYTGADAPFYEPSKELMKKMAYYYDIPTSPWAFVFDVDLEDDGEAARQCQEAVSGLTYPLIVKHFNGYSSVGMSKDSKVVDLKGLVAQVRKFVREFGGALVEQFIPGREFTVLVVENAADPEAPHTLVPVECVFSEGEDFKHFDLKWKDYESMAWKPIDAAKECELDAALRDAAARAFVALKGCSYGRCDFRVTRSGEVFFLEINPNCGIFYPKDAMGSADFILSLDEQMRHAKFIEHIIACAHARHARKAAKRVFEVKYKHGSGYGMYAARDIEPGETVIHYEERPHVIVTQRYIARNFGRGAVPGPSPVPPFGGLQAQSMAAATQPPLQAPGAHNGVSLAHGGKEGGEGESLTTSLKGQWFKAYAYPITDEVWVTWSENPDDWLPLNHSCDPSTWLDGLNLVARRRLRKGEHITADYATFNVHNTAEFGCKCGAARCRGRVTGTDFLQPWLEEWYGEHISDYVSNKRKEAKIAGML